MVVVVAAVLEVVVVMASEEQELQCHWPPVEVLPVLY